MDTPARDKPGMPAGLHRMFTASTSATSSSERGHPCLTPLDREKKEERCPLTMTALVLLVCRGLFSKNCSFCSHFALLYVF